MDTTTAASGRRSGGDRRGNDSAHRIARAVSRSTTGDRLARVGLAARGLVFLILAYLVARVALGALGGSSTSKPADAPGVAQTLAAQPGGRVVLFLLAIGMLLYALFSLLDTILHHDDENPAAKKWADRAVSAWGVVLFCAFGAYSMKTALSSTGGSQTARQSDRRTVTWSAHVLRWPAGWLWLGLLGVILLVICGFLITRAARRSFRTRLRDDAMGPRVWRVAMVLGTLGYLGRAGLFGLVGWFVLTAAIENDPRKGQGVDGSVRMFARSAAGPYLLWALVVALAAYGLYVLIESRYRRV